MSRAARGIPDEGFCSSGGARSCECSGDAGAIRRRQRRTRALPRTGSSAGRARGRLPWQPRDRSSPRRISSTVYWCR
jgi:hypothetical protein